MFADGLMSHQSQDVLRKIQEWLCPVQRTQCCSKALIGPSDNMAQGADAPPMNLGASPARSKLAPAAPPKATGTSYGPVGFGSTRSRMATSVPNGRGRKPSVSLVILVARSAVYRFSARLSV